MENFQELKERRPQLAAQLEVMTKKQLLDRVAIEIQEMINFKDDMEYFEKDLEHIIHLATKWLISNEKHDHVIIINKENAKVIKIQIESEFI
ncbi:hypothetical protein [Chryseobacterium arthrosphaerae]|uniref:hypothetical protein n=1 Tax=Chryseobacterium arthrosphaerae TaxID=651561 RepID=UPI0031D1C930